MTGQKSSGMKMRSKCLGAYDEQVFKIKSKDVISMRTIWEKQDARYLVIQISKSKEFIEVLPLEQFFINREKIEAPVLAVPFYMIENIENIDKTNLLFLANQPNPHILKALEDM